MICGFNRECKTMRILYYDEVIQQYENKLEFRLAINYLEKLFSQRNEVQILNSLIAYSWFYFVEGGLLKKNIEVEEIDFLFESWKKYFLLGEEKYSENSEFSLIVGYILSIHGFYLDIVDYQKQSIQMLQSVNDKNLELLAKYFITGQKTEDFEFACRELFPSDSMLDKYFREILI